MRLALIGPVAVLVAVVGLALVGRIGTSREPIVPIVAVRSSAPHSAAPTAGPTIESVAAPIAPIQRRETGTDGLMGRLPFDLPPDETSAVVNRFQIDDVVTAPTTWDTRPPWARRLGASSGDQTDPDRP